MATPVTPGSRLLFASGTAALGGEDSGEPWALFPTIWKKPFQGSVWGQKGSQRGHKHQRPSHLRSSQPRADVTPALSAVGPREPMLFGFN